MVHKHNYINNRLVIAITAYIHVTTMTTIELLIITIMVIDMSYAYRANHCTKITINNNLLLIHNNNI